MYMRSEATMMALIRDIAMKDDRVRAVYMNGSRTNPNIKKDKYQDYDVVFCVTETESFIGDKGWLEQFGEPAMIQEPDSNDCGWGIDADFSRRYAWLMLFKDGNRIDLTIQVREETEDQYGKDSLTLSVLDKDGWLTPIDTPDESSYYILRPTASQYRGTCNEFWWCLNNVAKGIARKEVAYTMWMFNEIVRIQLHKIMDWSIGIHYGFELSVGKKGKMYPTYLTTEDYETYLGTYRGIKPEEQWVAVFTACALFSRLAKEVGQFYDYDYIESEEINTLTYLEQVKDDLLLIADEG